MRKLTFAAAFGLIAAPALALAETNSADQDAPAIQDAMPAGDQLLRGSYTCEDGARFDVVYVNTEAGNYAVVGLGDRMIRLIPAVSASGARYLSHPGENPDVEADMYYQLWTKGPEATLTLIAPGENAGENTEEDIFLTCMEEELSDIDLTEEGIAADPDTAPSAD